MPAAALEFRWLNFDLLSSCVAAFAFSAELALADQISSWGDPACTEQLSQSTTPAARLYLSQLISAHLASFPRR
jgi:hypothetical protein